MILRVNPIKKSIKTLKTFLYVMGLFLLAASGRDIPIMKRNAGKTKSARVIPFHGWCTSHHADPYIPSRWSATIIPSIVNPLYASRDSNLSFFSPLAFAEELHLLGITFIQILMA
jgi:hypothetical protein